MKESASQIKPAKWEPTNTPNLIRNKSSGTFYARFRLNGKLVWRSLETSIHTTAKLKLQDVIGGERKLIAAGDGQITFEQAGKLYLERIDKDPNLKPRTKAYNTERYAALLKTWTTPLSQKLRNIKPDNCLEWASGFAVKYSASSFNHSLGILREIFEIGIDSGARFDNPARKVERLPERSKRLTLPEPDQFERFVREIEQAGGGFSKGCAELVQFFAFTGLRKTEAQYVTWGDIDFQKRKMSVRGHPETGTKGNGDPRIVPLIEEAVLLLQEIHSERPDAAPGDPVMSVRECQKAMNRAAIIVGMKRITHHDLRHLFATRCIESGVDIPTVSRWLGHKDGGALAMRVYGHLRDQHSTEMARRVSFSKPAGDNILRLPKMEAVI